MDPDPGRPGRRTIPAGAGRHARRLEGRAHLRTIPAGAGATCSRRPPCGPAPDDPRRRGGDPLWFRLWLRQSGRSPQPRGRHTGAGGLGAVVRPIPHRRGGDARCAVLDAVHRRTIPAGAGRTHGTDRRDGPGTDHPAGAGATIFPSSLTCSAPDDPRGRHLARRQRVRAGRTIPAGAGATASSRTIPAGAGATSTASWMACSRSDDPRGRGGDAAQREHRVVERGPYPRRGVDPASAGGLYEGGRTIPAGGGSTARYG